MFDIITFGSACKDVFLDATKFPIGDFKPDDDIEQEILLPFGHKVEIEEVHVHSGGGGTNTAATFSIQELKVAYCGVVGKDLEGDMILKELKERGIRTEFVFQTDNYKTPTNISVIFSTPEDRTILFYKGASEVLNIFHIPWSKIKNTKWFYLASFGKKSKKVFNKLIDFAKDNQIKVIMNPSSFQLKLSPKILYPILEKTDILLLNQEEGQVLVRNNTLKEEGLIKEIKKFFPGILILTNGKYKVLVADEKFLYSALPLLLKIKILDVTGAGDAFGAGFLSGYIKSRGDIVFSIQMAIANSTYCIREWGAKNGILKRDQRFRKVRVKKQKL